MPIPTIPPVLRAYISVERCLFCCYHTTGNVNYLQIQCMLVEQVKGMLFKSLLFEQNPKVRKTKILSQFMVDYGILPL
jgi:hypothetical protein